MTTKYEKQFQMKLDYLNRILNRPSEPWTKQENGHFVCNVGNLHIDYNSGDSYPYLYRLAEMMEYGGIHAFSGSYMTAREFLGFLNGMITFAEMERK